MVLVSQIFILNFKIKCNQGLIRQFSKIGFVGLGVMGSQMAKNLIKKYNSLTVYDVNQAALQSIQKDGAKIAKNLHDLSAETDCIITMLPASEHVLEVYAGKNGILSKIKRGSLLIDSSTVDPQISQQLSSSAKEVGVEFVDAPVSGGMMAASLAQLTFMVGGTKEAADLAKPVLSSMGKNIIYCGPSGSGEIVKMCNNMLLGISMVGVSEAMNLGIRLGMDPKVLASVINTSTGYCWSSQVYNPVPNVLENVPSSKNYQGGFQSKLLVKDLTIALSAAERSGSCTPLGKLTLEVYKSLCKSGKANLDFSVVYDYLKNLDKT